MLTVEQKIVQLESPMHMFRLMDTMIITILYLKGGKPMGESFQDCS